MRSVPTAAVTAAIGVAIGVGVGAAVGYRLRKRVSQCHVGRSFRDRGIARCRRCAAGREPAGTGSRAAACVGGIRLRGCVRVRAGEFAGCRSAWGCCSAGIAAVLCRARAGIARERRSRASDIARRPLFRCRDSAKRGAASRRCRRAASSGRDAPTPSMPTRATHYALPANRKCACRCNPTAGRQRSTKAASLREPHDRGRGARGGRASSRRCCSVVRWFDDRPSQARKDPSCICAASPADVLSPSSFR